MAAKQNQVELNPLLIGASSSKLFVPDEVFESIVNAYPTEEGSYRSLLGPSTLVPGETGGPPDSGALATHVPLQYGPVHGIHHALLRGGERDVLLLHTGTQIWEFRWWDREWYPLIGPASVSQAQISWASPLQTTNRWPTQWVSTPTGVVIIPQNARSYFYDGKIVAELGFSAPPAPPIGLGPISTESRWDSGIVNGGINDKGYSVHGLLGRPGGMNFHLGKPRIGTIYSPDSTATDAVTSEAHGGGYLLPGRWRAKVQFIDDWGNLSPLSGASNDLAVERMPAMIYDTGTNSSLWTTPGRARRQLAWDGISLGPAHTKGRIIFRTKDLENSGDANFYELPLNASVVTGAFATLPDRASSLYPDNIPDAWLVNRPIEVDPVPTFRLAALAFSRMWIANAEGDEGMLHPSEVGRWGTFASGGKLYPDPRASEITGLHAVEGGLLVFTERSTFIVTENDAGNGFRAQTLSTTSGCVAPSSIATMRSGITVWLGQDGFYGYSGGQVVFLFANHRRIALRINKSRYGFSSAVFDNESGQYQCWVPVDGSLEPNRRFKYDGTSWHWDDYDGSVSMRGVCITEDHRRLQLSCGTVGNDTGVWALDRGGTPETMTVKTGWIRAMRSERRASTYRIKLWLREMGTSADVEANKIQVQVRRNWRADVVDTFTVETYPEVDLSRVAYEPNPTFWPFVAGADGAVIRRRRPFWASVDINASHSEVFQVELSCPKAWEIVGMSVLETVSDDGGASSRR